MNFCNKIQFIFGTKDLLNTFSFYSFLVVRFIKFQQHLDLH